MTVNTPLSDETDRLNYLMWMAGRIRHLYKEVVDVGEEQAKHVTQVKISFTSCILESNIVC